MPEIHVLDQNTINQIAAGEVVERPASIVKELVENAVDARSNAITIEIKGGGIDFIRITDNGIGIAGDQIKKAFLRHATSKIESAEDLTTVATLGFRGEALSSICAVAKVELITKTDEGISGVRYIIEGGEEVSFQEIGCPEGTTLVVRNLFYNTPARRKFLKTGMTEAGYVEAFVQRLALSHPDISFKFISDHKNKIVTAGNGNLKDVIYHIFGRDIAMNLLPVDYEKNGITIRGYIGKPVISRGNRNYENYFVGGRYLKNNIIARAIEDGYKGHNMVHKFPFAVLMIDMDPVLYDVNVHPAKMEMRFKNAEELYSAIVTAVSGAFMKKELITRVTPGKDHVSAKDSVSGKNQRKNTSAPASVPEPFEKKRREIEERFQSLSPEKIDQIKRAKKEETGSGNETASGGVGSITDSDRRIASGGPSPLTDFDKRTASGDPAADANKRTAPGIRKPDSAMETLSSSLKSDFTGRTDLTSQRIASGRDSFADSAPVTGSQMSFNDIPFLSEQARPEHRIIGQVFRTYWIVEYQDQMFFVDQHAAHEKVMYEKLKKGLQNRRIDQQIVAPPIILNFSLKEKSRYLMCREAFADMGYQIEEFGEDAYCIRAVPASLCGIDQQDFFVEMLDGIDEGSAGPDSDMLIDRLATMACKAAVKGNQTMSVAEMDSLMDQLLKLENPYQCPHGRPTIIAMTKGELEKKFKRT